MRRTLPIFCLILSLCGCSGRIPEPITYPYSQQQKMQASGHWEVLAKDLANRINNELIRNDYLQKAVYVEQTCGDEGESCTPHQTTAFNEAFRDLLITSLLGYGVPTSTKPDDGSIEILYKVQVVRHHTERIRSLQPGLLTAISSAIVVFRDAPTNLVLMGTGVAADIANTSLALSGHSEVIITTSMIVDERYLFRASDIYYINDKDFWHYQEHLPTTTNIRLSSPQKGPFRDAKPPENEQPMTMDPATEQTQQSL